MQTTYPKTERLSIGYDPKEDRLILTAHIQGEKSRRALITRRLLSKILDKMSTELASTHPAAERSPDPDQVLQMEHVAAVSKSNSDSSGSGNPQAPAESHLVVEAQIETQEQHLILGLLSEDKEPLAGIKLARKEAHQVLRMLMQQANKAEWGLENKAAWMEPLQYGKGGN